MNKLTLAATSLVGSITVHGQAIRGSLTGIEVQPLNVRDPFALVGLTPGVQFGGNFGNGGGTDVGRGFYGDDFDIGGGRSGFQEILLDGVPIIDAPMDAVQEFKVQANSYDAQCGRTTGGVVNVITRSGSNQFHGVAYDFGRHSNLDANTFFNKRNNIKLPSFARHQFGGTFGGPIWRNRVFFVDYEGLRQGFPLTSNSIVPTAAQRAGDFSQTTVTVYDPATTTYNAATNTSTRTQFAGNRIPTNRIDPVAAYGLASFLLGDVASGTVIRNNRLSTQGIHWATFMQDDWRLIDKLTLNQKFHHRSWRSQDHRKFPR